MKIVFDKIMEYVLKQINKGLAPTVEQLPPNMRYMYFDIKETITELITCLYSKISNNLCALIEGLLNKKIKRELPEKDGKSKAPRPPICSVEEFTGELIALNMNDMNTAVNGILDNVNKFLGDIQNTLGTVSGGIGSVKDLIGGITGSITSALSFENIKLNIFGCDLKPNCAASDYYTLHSGSGAAEDPQQPRPAQVDKASQQTTTPPQTIETPFAQPSQNQSDIITDITKGTQFINQSAQFIGSI
jgi:hypothetical protein